MTLMGEPYKPSQRAPATKAAAAPSKESEAMAEVRRLQAILGPAKPMVKTSADSPIPADVRFLAAAYRTAEEAGLVRIYKGKVIGG